MRVYLVSWCSMNEHGLRSETNLAHVEAESGSEAEELTVLLLEREGYERVQAKAHRYIRMGEYGVEDIS